MGDDWKKIEEGAVIKHDIKKSPNTGSWRYMKPVVNGELCAGCGNCIPVCPEAAIEFDEKRKADIDFDVCKGCGVCAAVCPQKAINMTRTSAGG